MNIPLISKNLFSLLTIHYWLWHCRAEIYALLIYCLVCKPCIFRKKNLSQNLSLVWTVGFWLCFLKGSKRSFMSWLLFSFREKVDKKWQFSPLSIDNGGVCLHLVTTAFLLPARQKSIRKYEERNYIQVIISTERRKSEN